MTSMKDRAAAEALERENESRRNARMAHKKAKEASLGTEPTKAQTSILIGLRLPKSGKRLRRRFLPTDLVSKVFDWLDADGSLDETLSVSMDGLLSLDSLTLVGTNMKLTLPLHGGESLEECGLLIGSSSLLTAEVAGETEAE
uniref:UBX domain-containing protein n=1 Tax=Octactis speculum TaxID=3111310 RepID=A0A7S2G5A6_9STRA